MTQLFPTESESFFIEAAGEWRHTFVWPERFITTNQVIRMHWRPVAVFTAEWKEAFRLMSVGCAPLAYCHVTVQTIHGSNRKMDIGAEALALKAAIDGIVKGGVLPDDNPEFVRSVLSLPPLFVEKEEALIVTLVGPPAAKEVAA